ncbi:tetratricopeptide repeat (TPR)-like superfamily protein isoform X1 [Wolffia australiana]
MSDQEDIRGKAIVDEIPVPVEILLGIMQQLQAMNSKLEASTVPSSKTGLREQTRYGRVQMNQETTAYQKVLFRKWDLPYFNGCNVQIWLNCVKRFFKVNRLTDEEKLQLVSLHMEGPALGWFIYTEENFGFGHWLVFRQHFEKRYHFSNRSLCNQLMSLKQTGTVSEYRSEFEDLCAFLSHVPPDIQETAYFRGLKPAIRVELNKYRPDGIQEMMDYSIEAESNLAILEEEERVTLTATVSYKPHNFTLPRENFSNKGEGLHSAQASRVTQNPLRGDTSHKGNKKKFTKLSTEEFLQRKERGLCYHCNDQYTPGHRCQKKLSIYMLEEEVEEVEQPLTEEDFMQLDEGPLMTGELMSLQKLSTDTGPKHGSFRLWGEIYNQKVTILIDGGATNNFIRPTIIQRLKIPVHPYHKFSIAMGDGHCRQTAGICLNLPIAFQGLVFKQNLVPFPLGSCDLILGVPWLKTLGWFHCNYHHLMLKFTWKGQIHTTISDPELNSLRYSQFYIDQANQEWKNAIHQIVDQEGAPSKGGAVVIISSQAIFPFPVCSNYISYSDIENPWIANCFDTKGVSCSLTKGEGCAHSDLTNHV